jgi:hypothetical protein
MCIRWGRQRTSIMLMVLSGKDQAFSISRPRHLLVIDSSARMLMFPSVPSSKGKDNNGCPNSESEYTSHCIRTPLCTPLKLNNLDLAWVASRRPQAFKWAVNSCTLDILSRKSEVILIAEWLSTSGGSVRPRTICLPVSNQHCWRRSHNS